MTKKTYCPRGLDREFEHYYALHRCLWAPASPHRIFNLCFKHVFPAYRNRMSPEQLLATIYRTLGIPGDKPAGLFHSFDPEKYKGQLPLEAHFVNLFKWKLKGNLGRVLRRATDRSRRGDQEKFVARTEIGLQKVETRFSQHNVKAVESLPEALSLLEGDERRVIQSTYWGGGSTRKIGLELRMDHKTVERRRDAALAKLQRFYEAGAA